jgi:hypothetical protein
VHQRLLPEINFAQATTLPLPGGSASRRSASPSRAPTTIRGSPPGDARRRRRQLRVVMHSNSRADRAGLPACVAPRSISASLGWSTRR